jgi:hypothetical protein
MPTPSPKATPDHQKGSSVRYSVEADDSHRGQPSPHLPKPLLGFSIFPRSALQGPSLRSGFGTSSDLLPSWYWRTRTECCAFILGLGATT